MREVARRLSATEIESPKIKQLVEDMQHTLVTKKYGVGLAAPQVGQGVALTVIWIKPLPHRPKVEEQKLVAFNPEVVKTYGNRTQLWEGCISFQGSSSNFPYAKALRWRKVRVRYIDEYAHRHERDFEGLLAHVLQHEIDHLNGVLFVERVKDPKTFMMVSEYKKHVLPNDRKRQKKQ